MTLEVRSLVKRFGKTVALSGASFTARGGEILALLGPNGAGKTTCLRIIAGVLTPDEGDVLFDGAPLAGVARARALGYLPAGGNLYARLTPRETARVFARLAGCALDEDALFAGVGMEEERDRLVGKLSAGNVQKAALARALVGEPPCLLLDEPTAGLDLEATQAVERLLREQRDRGRVVVLSTHMMEEAEQVADRIAVIADGRIRTQGTMDELRETTGKRSVREIYLAALGRTSGA